jgi:hypothetical protein
MDIIVHIGHGKTGTSAIQSFLALNSDLLSKYNLVYPQDESTEQASLGRISSGNRAAFVHTTKFDSEINYLFSNEAFFDDIDKKSHVFDKLLSLKSRVKVVLFTRDLFEHTFSNWGQSIKRSGAQEDIHTFCTHAHNMYRRVDKVIRTLQSENIAFEVFNYSRHKHQLEKFFLSIIAPIKFLEIYAQAQRIEHPVNRSLSLSEYELQRHFNRHYGSKSSDFISDALVNKLPNVNAQQPMVKNDVALTLAQKAGSYSVFINQFLNKDEKLSLTFDDADLSDTQLSEFTFSSEQLDILAEAISVKLKTLEEVSLKQSDVDVLRDVALKFENKTAVSKTQAIHLLQLAAKVRPDGPVIRQKLTNWLAHIKSE